MLIYGVIYMYMHCKIVLILTYENGLSSFHCLYGTFMFMDSFKIIAFKNIQRYMSDCPNLEWHMLKLFLYILQVLIIAEYMIKYILHTHLVECCPCKLCVRIPVMKSIGNKQNLLDWTETRSLIKLILHMYLYIDRVYLSLFPYI